MYTKPITKFLMQWFLILIDTRQHTNFHQPSVNLTKYKKGVYYLGVKVFNKHPTYVKTESDNTKKFKLVLQKFLYENFCKTNLNFLELSDSVFT